MANFDSAVKKAWETLQAEGVQKHVHSKDCLKMLKHVLHPKEETYIEAKQSAFETLAPTKVVATNKRLIVVKPSFWAIHIGYDLISPTNYEIIPYQYILGVTLAKGKALSTIKIHHHGGGSNEEHASTISDGCGVSGIKTKQAARLVNFVEEIIEAGQDANSQSGTAAPLTSEKHKRIAYNELDLSEALGPRYAKSKFIWLGIESAAEVVKVLGIDPLRVVQLGTAELSRYQTKDVAKLANGILVSYDGVLAQHVSRHLKRKLGIELPVLRGGIEEAAARMHKDDTVFLD